MCISIIICAGKETPNIKDIRNYVVPKWAAKWRQLGTQLNIDQHVMDIVECDNRNDCRSCCLKMFCKWLEINHVASWEDILTAVDSLSPDGMQLL